jgi:Ni,Fe-hydrogenase I large subunit
MPSAKKWEILRLGKNNKKTNYLLEGHYCRINNEETAKKLMFNCMMTAEKYAVLNNKEFNQTVYNTGDVINNFIPPQLRSRIPITELRKLIIECAQTIGFVINKGQYLTEKAKNFNCIKGDAVTGTLIDFDEYPFWQFIDEILDKIQKISEARNDSFYD